MIGIEPGIGSSLPDEPKFSLGQTVMTAGSEGWN